MALLGGNLKHGFLLGRAQHPDAVRPAHVLHAQQQRQQHRTLLRKPLAPLAMAQPQQRIVPSASAAQEPASQLLPWQAAMSDVKKRRDLKKIMVLGAGPIIIGQVRAMDVAGVDSQFRR
eukprot:881020-Pelagomonas_calceolata.AAC.5